MLNLKYEVTCQPATPLHVTCSINFVFISMGTVAVTHHSLIWYGCTPKVNVDIAKGHSGAAPTISCIIKISSLSHATAGLAKPSRTYLLFMVIFFLV